MLMTAVNICYGEEEKRGFVSFNPNLFNPVRLGREDAYTCSLNRPNLEPALHRGELGSREDR
jgi:hypothetical protein